MRQLAITFGEYPSLTGFSFNYSAQPFTFSNKSLQAVMPVSPAIWGVGFSNPSTRLHVNGPIRGNGAAGSLTVEHNLRQCDHGDHQFVTGYHLNGQDFNFQFDKPV
jgi:hypothetical protein